jgi:hypothetical protein
MVYIPPAVPQPQPRHHPCSTPGWSSATSSTSTTIDTATERWATARRPRTPPSPGRLRCWTGSAVKWYLAREVIGEIVDRGVVK